MGWSINFMQLTRIKFSFLITVKSKENEILKGFERAEMSSSKEEEEKG